MPEYQNTFRGANPEFPNLGIHFLLAEIIKFRKQLTVRQEFRSQSGWNDALNRYMVTEIEKLGDTLENVTYNPDELTLEELESQAANSTRSVADDYNDLALTQDNVLMPVGVNRHIVWDLTGADLDIPQLEVNNCPNDAARAFVTALDNIFVELTRLDSRHQPYSVTKYESVMVRSLLNVLYTLTQRKGGEANRSDIPTGTLPSDEAGTFQA
jgi:hypothetical protein